MAIPSWKACRPETGRCSSVAREANVRVEAVRDGEPGLALDLERGASVPPVLRTVDLDRARPCARHGRTSAAGAEAPRAMPWMKFVCTRKPRRRRRESIRTRGRRVRTSAGGERSAGRPSDTTTSPRADRRRQASAGRRRETAEGPPARALEHLEFLEHAGRSSATPETGSCCRRRPARPRRRWRGSSQL